jgi:hypothetical protein
VVYPRMASDYKKDWSSPLHGNAIKLEMKIPNLILSKGPNFAECLKL